ncbi:MAG: 2-dehydro-3-deoxyphosphogluconate aldolase / (4S)-4-hydroxy-2-oxoglutarate aldolase, partial [Solirubrobacteraceae bacterium]|nr:2-dehydro-3-deoxyphosphogluconate aldolase / (4S)-4-hydroxy-2-oxoglutarate aldolase [Solirubrobacteraceae bacterium]
MSPQPASFRTLLADRRVIAVVRQHDDAAAEAIARAAAGGGLRAVEITTSVPRAAALIATLRASLAADVLVGAGTVLSVQQLDDVLAAGAQFVVAPGLDRVVVERCVDARVPIVPGALTPTEVMAGRALGLDALKLFPSDTAGPAHLRALRSVFAD